MLATKGKQAASKQAEAQIAQAAAKAQGAAGGLGEKAELDVSFVPYLLGQKAEQMARQGAPVAAEPAIASSGRGQGPIGAAAPERKDKKPKDKAQKDEKNTSPDPSATTESVTDAAYAQLKGEAFVKAEADKNAASPDDVKQGSLGNCYLMAALAAVANTDPQVLQDMVKDNGDSTYTVTFYLKEGRVGVFSSGSKVTIRVTDQFPMRGGKPAFGKTGDAGAKGPELWVMLIEKAWAIHQGSYEESRGSKSRMDSNIMSYITGKGTRTLSCSSTAESELTKQMLASNTAGNPITASMPNKNAVSAEIVTAAEAKGLYFNHAYTVMTVDKDGKVTLRNPWGSHDPPVLEMADFKKIFNNVQINAA